MLIVKWVSPSVVPYFMDGRDTGRWTPGAAALGLAGPVDARSLRAVLRGCDPTTGAYLPRWRPARRRAGWDLIFAAPKSLSLLAGPVAQAHRAAVDSVTAHLAARVTNRQREPSDVLVGAAFHHTENAGGEPHLHTHLLIANLSRAGVTWGALDGPWTIGRPALGALYQLELRHQLARHGFDLPWRLRPDGLADLADVPRATVRAASRQSQLVAGVGRFEARRQAVPHPRPVVDPVDVASRPAPGARPSLGDPSVERAVTVRLTAARSDFRAEDVVVALAATYAGGARTDEVSSWVERYCAESMTAPRPSPTAHPRWTTPAACRTDEQLTAALRERDGIRFLAAAPGTTPLLAQAELVAAARADWEDKGATVALASPTPDGPLRWQVLAGVPAWSAGQRPDVLIVDAADRWRTAELERLTRSAGQLVLVEGGTRPRLTNPASHGLFALADEVPRYWCPEHEMWIPGGGAARDLAVGLVEPSGLGPAPGLGRLGRSVEAGRYVEAGRSAETGRAAEAARTAAARRLAEAGPSLEADRPAEAGRVGREAAEWLLGEWRSAGGRPILVGLGLEEVRALNDAAVGRPHPPAGPERFAAGDRVVVLRGRPGVTRYGQFGTVLDRSDRHGVTFGWDDGTRTVSADRRVLDGVGFGYAVSARRAPAVAGQLMVLGPAAALGPAHDRVVAETGLVRGSRLIERSRPGPALRL